MAKKYFWLKLKDDWFNSKVIKKLRRIAGGDTYTIIYLKMLLLSLKNEGKIYYEGVEDSFEEELALDLNEDIDNVTVTIAYLQKNGLLEILDTNEYFLSEVPEAIGSETDSARRMRISRGNKGKVALEDKMSHCDNIVLECDSNVTKCDTDIEIDIEKELEKNIEKDNTSCAEQASAPEPEPIITLPLNTGDEYPFYQHDLDMFSQLYPAVDILQAMRGMRGWLLTNPTRRKTPRGIKRFVNSWLAREQDKGGTRGYSERNQGSRVESFGNMAKEWANE